MLCCIVEAPDFWAHLFSHRTFTYYFFSITNLAKIPYNEFDESATYPEGEIIRITYK